MTISVAALTGNEITGVLEHLAQLRMTVFREWPYLYDGTLDYEKNYLAKLAAAEGAVCVVARDGEDIVGASTGAPMIEHADEFGAPFRAAGYDISKIFYCSESVLLPSHRGQGLGHTFFDKREAHANQLGGFTHSTFCRVIRAPDHPMKPDNYVALDRFWTKRGYKPIPSLIATYPWLDLGETKESEHDMQFWIKALA